MYRIAYSREASKALNRLPRNTADLIRSKVQALAVDPFAPNNNVTALKGEPGYRLRVGMWRIVYVVDGEALIVVVVRIRPRESAYNG